MASNYPSGLDTFTNPAGTDNLAAGIGHAAQHDNINDAVRAVEVELGTTPKGSDASVAARLARFDANGFVTPIRTSGGYFDTATNYTLTNNDRVVDVTGTTAITLPTSTGSAGRTFTVRNNGAGTVTIGTTGGQLIDGAAAQLADSLEEIARSLDEKRPLAVRSEAEESLTRSLEQLPDEQEDDPLRVVQTQLALIGRQLGPLRRLVAQLLGESRDEAVPRARTTETDEQKKVTNSRSG